MTIGPPLAVATVRHAVVVKPGMSPSPTTAAE
jgi:hypothetical protein